jgi:hypothetical protein
VYPPQVDFSLTVSQLSLWNYAGDQARLFLHWVKRECEDSVMDRKKFYAWGEGMINISFGLCLKMSSTALGIGAAIAVFRTNPEIDIEHSGQIFWLLLQYGSTALIAIFVLALVCKSLAYGLGRLLLWAVAEDQGE